MQNSFVGMQYDNIETSNLKYMELVTVELTVYFEINVLHYSKR